MSGAVRMSASSSGVSPRGASSKAPSRRHLAFVYGTLKRGGHNHGLYLVAAEARGRAAFVGEARTAESLPLLLRRERGVPCLVNMDGYPGARRVRGELYEVDDACLAALDLVEGVSAGFYSVAGLRVEAVGPDGGDTGVFHDALTYVYGPDAGRFASPEDAPGGGPVHELLLDWAATSDPPLEAFGPDQQRAYEPPRGGAPLPDALRLVSDDS